MNFIEAAYFIKCILKKLCIRQQTYQILPFSHAHLLHYGPKPAFKLQ